MASEDVIELGSSDDEAEPAPKKMKTRPNAMVHIPRKLHGVKIKPVKPSVTAVQGFVGNAVTVKKINSIVSNPLANQNKPNGRPILPKQVSKPALMKPAVRTVLQKPIQIQTAKSTINPISLMKKLSNSQVMINKVPSNIKSINQPVKVKSPKTLNNLPPSITVTKTSGGLKRVAVASASNVRKKQKQKPVMIPSEVLTVELDDDEASESSTASPVWYLRPEDQANASNMEQKNNAEPEMPKFIEITIEDSPVKPVFNKRTCEIGTELAITIDDSPVKSVRDKLPSTSSDEETAKSNKVPHSKKKLDYPKTTNIGSHTIEIEIESMDPLDSGEKNVDDTVSIQSETVVEIEESPIKKTQKEDVGTPKKEARKEEHHLPKTTIKDTELDDQNTKEDGEFHPVYQKFIDLCFQLENSDDMSKIVEKKIKAYYRQVPKEYTESEDFLDMVSSKIICMRAGPEKLYLYIKDIVDELNLQRKMAKSQALNKEPSSSDADKFSYADSSDVDSKRQRQIRKLEKTLKKLHRAIQKLEEQEVDFDDEEDSVYLLTESEDSSCSSKDIGQLKGNPKKLLQRYKERMVRVHAKFCQLTKTKMPSEPRVQLDARPGRPEGPAKRLEKWINRKVPVGKPLPFPDFHDVIRCVRDANDEDKLRWNEADIMEEARDLFTRCGKKLQRRRQENEWRSAVSRITLDTDPAEEDEQLKKKLEENRQTATKKETDVFNKYADRQSLLNLEAVEIGDREAEESPVESEDDDPIEESSNLENKEKRKERLRRLIQEKSKRIADDKENNPKETETNQVTVEILSEDNNKNETDKDLETDKKELESKDSNINPLDVIHKNKAGSEIFERIHSISDDDSNKIMSDVDELNLLQKLHSGNEINSSTLESSDTDTPINISDTLQSSSDNKGKQTSDVMSIENSSFSESEVNKDDNSKEIEQIISIEENNKSDVETVSKTVNTDDEIQCSPSGSEKKTVQTNNEEYNDPVESILLASSDDEASKDINDSPGTDDACANLRNDSPGSADVCVNLRDDAISIGDTVIQEADQNKDKTTSENNKADAVTTECKNDVNQNAASLEENVASLSTKDNNGEVDEKQLIEELSDIVDQYIDSSIVQDKQLEKVDATTINCSETLIDHKIGKLKEKTTLNDIDKVERMTPKSAAAPIEEDIEMPEISQASESTEYKDDGCVESPEDAVQSLDISETQTIEKPESSVDRILKDDDIAKKINEIFDISEAQKTDKPESPLGIILKDDDIAMKSNEISNRSGITENSDESPNETLTDKSDECKGVMPQESVQIEIVADPGEKVLEIDDTEPMDAVSADTNANAVAEANDQNIVVA